MARLILLVALATLLSGCGTVQGKARIEAEVATVPPPVE